MMTEDQRQVMLQCSTEVAHLACSDLPKDFSEYGRRIWRAFELGKTYQEVVDKAVRKEKDLER